MTISASLKEKLIKSGWYEHLEEFFNSPEWISISKNISKVDKSVICPKMGDVFNAFTETPFEKIKCVIVGDSPYVTPNTANGLAFSVNENKMRTPELSIIIREVESDTNSFISKSSKSLFGWVNQGVLLLNSVLTSERGRKSPQDHIGWESFTDFVIKVLLTKKQNMVYMLWGDRAIAKFKRVPVSITVKSSNKVLESSGPYPDKAGNGFYGCRHFLQANDFYKRKNITPIDWTKIDNMDLYGDVSLPSWTKKDEIYDKRRYKNTEDQLLDSYPSI